MVPSGLAQWIRELTTYPVSLIDLETRVCRGLSEVLGGVEVLAHLPPWSHAGGWSPRLENGNQFWVPRRTLMDNGRALIWVKFKAGWIGASLESRSTPAAEHSKIEQVLLAAALRLNSLQIQTELEKKLESRDRFLAIASHELKTPLTAISGLLQLQERVVRSKAWPSDPRELREEQDRYLSHLRLVLKQLQRLHAMIDGLMDLSRIRAGRFEVERIPLDAAQSVRELVEGRLLPLAEEAGVELLTQIPERLLARLDPLRFEEAVTNLVMQGVNRSQEGGQVQLDLSATGGGICVRVRDSGAPLPREEREGCFEPFSTVTNGQSGLGLGLYLARQIVRLHGGEVSWSQTPSGRGNLLEATFLDVLS